MFKHSITLSLLLMIQSCDGVDSAELSVRKLSNNSNPSYAYVDASSSPSPSPCEEADVPSKAANVDWGGIKRSCSNFPESPLRCLTKFKNTLPAFALMAVYRWAANNLEQQFLLCQSTSAQGGDENAPRALFNHAGLSWMGIRQGSSKVEILNECRWGERNTGDDCRNLVSGTASNSTSDDEDDEDDEVTWLPHQIDISRPPKTMAESLANSYTGKNGYTDCTSCHKPRNIAREIDRDDLQTAEPRKSVQAIEIAQSKLCASQMISDEEETGCFCDNLTEKEKFRCAFSLLDADLEKFVKIHATGYVK